MNTILYLVCLGLFDQIYQTLKIFLYKRQNSWKTQTLRYRFLYMHPASVYFLTNKQMLGSENDFNQITI